MRLAVIGGGAAGFFGAIAAASANSSARVDLLEAAAHPLQKVKISGGGRCNVTHHCFEPRDLVKGYPRGARELLGPFTRFGPRETVEWFERHGVRLKAEADGRMFPVTDRSATVVESLMRAANEAGVNLRVAANVRRIATSEPGSGFAVELSDGTREGYDKILLASGGNPAGYRIAASLGHAIVPCVPSLFTFNVRDARLDGLSGISFDEVELTLSDGTSKDLKQTGPLLITHWGLSGPAVLKLSAWGARMMAGSGYHATLTINLVPGKSASVVKSDLEATRAQHLRKLIDADRGFSIPTRYWSRLVEHAGIAAGTIWSGVSNKALAAVVAELTAAQFAVSGKGVFKEEFVTCGGVTLSEVDFKTMQSKIVPGLYFAGEILDIDGITGGFNFQSAWTTGWIGGEAMA